MPDRIFEVEAATRVFGVSSEAGEILGSVLKAPGAILDYGIDWTEWAEAAGDTIASATFTAPDGIAAVSGSDEIDGNCATVKLSDGTAGESYEIVCTITTSNGLTDVRSFEVKVSDR